MGAVATRTPGGARSGILAGLAGEGPWGKAWLVLPAVLTVPALVLEPKWAFAWVVAVLVGLPAALLVRDARPWLLLAGAVSSFNYAKYLGDDLLPGTEPLGAPHLQVMDVPLVVLLAMALFRRPAEGETPALSRPELRSALLLGSAFVAWTLTGALDSTKPGVTLYSAVGYARMVLALGVVAASASTPVRVGWGLAGLFLSLAAQSALAIAQYLTGSSFGLYEHFEEDTAIGIFTRSGGTLNPTVLSEYVGLLAPVVLALAFGTRRRWPAAGLLGLFGAAAAAAFMSLSRGGLVSLVLTTVLLVGWALRHRETTASRKVLLGGGTVVVAALLGALFFAPLMARVGDVGAELEGDTGRLPQIRQAISMIIDNPVTGVGLGTYKDVMGRYGPVNPYPVHNKLLFVAAETGVLGGLLYLALWVTTLAVFAREAWRRRGLAGAFFAGASAGLLGTLVNMNTDVYGSGTAPELTLFLLAGLGYGLLAQRETGSAP